MIKVIIGLIIIVLLLISIAYLTLIERKIIGAIQRRCGPNVVGWSGMGTPLADGLKLRRKESVIPIAADEALFRGSPVVTFVLALIGWVVIPLGDSIVYVDRERGIIYSLAVSALSVYGIRVSGWSSNSKYAFLGARRSTAQIVSYEVGISVIVSSVRICSGSANRTDIVYKQYAGIYILPRFPMFIRYYVSTRAETNRHPFDLPEAEAELVSGYNVEYSSMGFALFFLGEYMNIIRISCISVRRFMGGWFIMGYSSCIIRSIKVIFRLIGFVGARAAYPRYRYDQLIRLGWKIYLPLTRGWVMLTSIFRVVLDGTSM